MGSPSDRAPERAPERFLVAIEACSGGTPDLSSYGCFKGTWDYIGERSRSGGARGAHEIGGRHPVRGPALLSRGLLEDLLT